MARPKREGSMGPTKQVTYRMPLELYEKLRKIGDSMFQPVPVVLRAAAAEFAKNHRPVRHRNTGISLTWDDVAVIRKEASLYPPDGMESTEPVADPDMEADTELTPTKEGT